MFLYIPRSLATCSVTSWWEGVFCRTVDHSVLSACHSAGMLLCLFSEGVRACVMVQLTLPDA